MKMSDKDFNEKFKTACFEFAAAQRNLNNLRIEQYKKFDMLDEDGYPTTRALQIIKLWPYDDKKGWFDFIKDIWWATNWGWLEENEPHEYKEGKTVHRYHISTGGWSGNESIIKAMQENENHLWMFTWVQSRRGGHYIFERQIND